MANWMRAHDLMHRVYEEMCYYPNGITAYKMAHLMGYSTSHMRVVLNKMVAEFPAYVAYIEDEYRGMKRKTYFAIDQSEEETE